MNDENALVTFEPAAPVASSDPCASPFKLVVDPAMRAKLRRALFDLIETHDQLIANHVSEGRLALDSYKEYVEIFASSLKQTMESREGVEYLLRSCGFSVKADEINLQPETRWKAAETRETRKED